MRVVGRLGRRDVRVAGVLIEQVTGPACRPLGRRHGGDRVIEAREGGVDEEARADGLSASEVGAPAVRGMVQDGDIPDDCGGGEEEEMTHGPTC